MFEHVDGITRMEISRNPTDSDMQDIIDNIADDSAYEKCLLVDS
jgi:hypothetical protein